MFPHSATSNYISNSFPMNTNEKWNNTVFTMETPHLILFYNSAPELNEFVFQNLSICISSTKRTVIYSIA
jgi:hypothetical protein